MTKKDYIKIAECFRVNRHFVNSAVDTRMSEDTDQSTWQALRDEVADMLARDNGRFNRERFIKACQGEGS